MATTRNSAQWCALRLLAYIGVTSLDPKPDSGANPDENRTYLAAGDLDTVAGTMTAALQDIAADGPAYLSNADPGGALLPPKSIMPYVSEGSTMLDDGSHLEPWMLGCSVLIAGDSWVNEIVSVNPSGGGGTLRRPYFGTLGLPQATVFGNSIALDPSFRTVLEPVEIAGGQRLIPCADRVEFDARSGCHPFSSAVQTGWPTHFLVESCYNSAASNLQLILRVAPAPQAALPITFKATLNPPTVNVSDIGTSTSDPGKTLPVPGGWIESIFLPYCLQRFSGSPLFKNDGARPEIARQFQEAKKRLAAFRPQIVRQGGTVAFRP